MTSSASPSLPEDSNPSRFVPEGEQSHGTAERTAFEKLRELSTRLAIPIESSLDSWTVSAAFLKTIPIGHARGHGVIGLVPQSTDTDDHQDHIVLALSRTDAWAQRDILSRRLGVDVSVILATEETVQSKIDSAYSDRGSNASGVLDTIETDQLADQLALLSSREDLLDSNTRAPVIQLVNQLLFDAVVAGASDVHVQPYENHLQVRQRVDGVLFDTFEIPKTIQEEVLTRIKVLGRMNIAEKRLPQDGRATVQLGSRVVDLRIASLPTSHNERIVIRLLDKSARRYTLDDLGMPDSMRSRWQNLIGVDHGLILVTGPTGSGKSTTLYSALQSLNSTQANILTLEDPIEYQLDGISQTQINEKKGLTFASGMRSLLRQDPDIIMVGEIRDAETANMAIQASLTGHLVFSTLHTNDAASAVTRLLDLGVQPYLVASSLVASLAQRLVRTLCTKCRVRKPNAQTDEPNGQTNEAIPVGCPACRQTGYSGRVGLFELLVVDEACRQHIQNRSGATQIRDAAIASGMTLLASDGRDKIRQGFTTLEEVVRVTQLSDNFGTDGIPNRAPTGL
ncbi:Type II secretion system protein E [Planctomycetes bacterium CA13]|uniref:Type II secretion system protein E n=1 Tax=Novipirellula herctigrandis TaxID=2527986 RepID=A0A5C5Z5B6_9BACT|nr:Type II secretion system protein E [Planctomycetes bacterium CA13]